MSEASVQFIELVRRAAARLASSAPLLPGERRHFCAACGRETPHVVADLDGRREVFTCRCGHVSVYTVR